MRPLRHGGMTPDVRWDESVVLVRRSHTLGDEVMTQPNVVLPPPSGAPSGRGGRLG
jgi:hypothetical protein